MKWQTGCQTPHGSETLTQTDGLGGWKGRERWKEGKRIGWHGDRMGGMTDSPT